MTIAFAVFPTDSPDNYDLAGESPLQRIVRTASTLTITNHKDSVRDLNLRSRLEYCLAHGIDRILLIKGDRPLLKASTLQLLVDFKPGDIPLLTLQPPDDGIAAACADVQWVWDQLQSWGGTPTLDELANLGSAPGVVAPDRTECLSINSPIKQAEAKQLIRERINLSWMQKGVQIDDPSSTYIHAGVEIGKGTRILPNTHLLGDTIVGQESKIGPNSLVSDSQIGDHCTVMASFIEKAVMEDDSDIGPFGHLRKGARMCRGAHMGNYGEMKNSTLGPNSKMGHFSYLGDAIIGKDVNIGAGTITCNYDGEQKHKTVIEDGAFIGSDTMLVAPLLIGAGARIGAGSVVTRDIPAGTVAYGVPARVINRDQEEVKGEGSGPSQ